GGGGERQLRIGVEAVARGVEMMLQHRGAAERREIRHRQVAARVGERRGRVGTGVGGGRVGAVAAMGARKDDEQREQPARAARRRSTGCEHGPIVSPEAQRSCAREAGINRATASRLWYRLKDPCSCGTLDQYMTSAAGRT